MTRWQYRLRYTNCNWGDGGPDAQWRDIGAAGTPALDIRDCSSLVFRRKPSRHGRLRRAFLRASRGERRPS